MRIRTVKPEFFTHEAIFEAEHKSGLPLRLAFIGLWCAADREGKLRWQPRRLGIQILPYDGIDFTRVMDALCDHGFLEKSANGEFVRIPSFLNHQCINQREAQSTIPDDAFTCTHVQDNPPPPYRYNGVNIQPKLRAFVIDRDGGACVRCGSREDLTIDHIFPQSVGGTHAPANLRTLCRSCNSGRPVQGQGLIDDLFSDGLSMDDMKRICTHVRARGEGKGREQGKEGEGADSADAESVIGPNPNPRAKKEHRADFEEFWQNYPKKEGKPKALQSWNKEKPDIDDVINALKWQKKNWTDPKYIPLPATYLNQRRFEDEPTRLKPQVAASPFSSNNGLYSSI